MAEEKKLYKAIFGIYFLGLIETIILKLTTKFLNWIPDLVFFTIGAFFLGLSTIFLLFFILLIITAIYGIVMFLFKLLIDFYKNVKLYCIGRGQMEELNEIPI